MDYKVFGNSSSLNYGFLRVNIPRYHISAFYLSMASTKESVKASKERRPPLEREPLKKIPRSPYLAISKWEGGPHKQWKGEELTYP